MNGCAEKRWVTATVEPAAVDGISRRYGFSRAMACALVARGLSDFDEIDQFLQPRLANLTDPFVLPDMAKAVDLILQHIEQGSSILIYGDYDVDGVTATALMIQVLSGLGAVVVPFLPLSSSQRSHPWSGSCPWSRGTRATRRTSHRRASSGRMPRRRVPIQASR